jgi:hyperosmotically inducible protein
MDMKLKNLAMTVLVGGALTLGTAAYAEDTVADWTTTLGVKLALLEKLGTDSLQVEVGANAGVLTLEGTVDKRETRELAETVAKTVEGVTSVKNDILLEASVEDPNKAGVAAGEAEAELKDAVLATKIRLALVNELGSDGFKIGTEVASGVVTLEFHADFAEARRREATTVVEGIEGVTKVVNLEMVASVDKG